MMLLKSLARQGLRALPHGVPVPVLRGPLRGWWWTTGALTNGCWLGTYEADKQKLFLSIVHSGDVVYDIGANAGFYTLLGAHLVGAGGAVYAFEPVPANLAVLRRHLELNRLRNVEVIGAAVAEQPGRMRFQEGEGSATGMLHEAGSLEVEVVSLDRLVFDGGVRPPQVMKIDVEGAELAVLRGADQLLRVHRPRLLVELHTPEMDRACPAYLRERGYEIHPMDRWPDGTTRVGFVAVPTP